MAINTELVRWASVLENDPVSGLDNRTEPPFEFKISGEKRNQPIPRQWLNWQFYQYYLMLQDLQDQINTPEEVSAITDTAILHFYRNR